MAKLGTAKMILSINSQLDDELIARQADCWIPTDEEFQIFLLQDAATRGQIGPLFDALRSGTLPAEGQVALARLLEEPKHERRGRGRPKKPLEQRQVAHVHLRAAAGEVPRIKQLLREYLGRRNVAELATEIAARRYGIGFDKLANYLRRSKHDRRRLD